MDIIYHGSKQVVKYPEIRIHRFTKDFSWGFYCTRIKEQAEKWSSKYTTPVVNTYRLKDISDLKVKVFKEYNKEWLDFVVHCRNGGLHEYDIVEGFMADDTIYDVLEDYINGYINEIDFLEMMKFKWSNNQISFHTIKALERIEFIDYENIEKKSR